jgi:ATP-dependent DNA ligase
MIMHPIPLPLDLAPMEAEAVDALPDGDGWQFEPKVDGFRAVAFCGEAVDIRSRRGKPLARYFPEMVEALAPLREAGAVVDGELVLAGGSFEGLQLRLHPAASRIARLAMDDPAELVAFDLLALRGDSLLAKPLAERRDRLEALLSEPLPRVRLGRATQSRRTALSWIGKRGLDGVVAKRLDGPYRPGERAVLKYKQWKTIDCVVGGYYPRGASGPPEYLLLGLYDEAGRLHYVGRTAAPDDEAATAEVMALAGSGGFTGRAPGGRSRWSGRERTAVPVRPELVIEVSADHITADHMRHGARLLRWRTDKDPRSCGMDQIR